MSLVTRAESHTGANAGLHLIGYFLNWGLLGVLVVQVFLYYLAFPSDKTSLKAMVYGLLILDAAQTIIITVDSFAKYGLEFANVSNLANMSTTWLSVPLINSLKGGIVQLFFAHRIMSLSGSKTLAGIIALLALAALGAGISEGVQCKINGDLATIGITTRTTLTIWLTISAAADIVIAVSMVYNLSRKRTGFNQSTDDLITKIMRLTVETGSITATLAILTVILFFALPDWAFWNVSLDVLGKFYSNSVLVIFNRRLHISDGRNAPSHIEGAFTSGKDFTRQKHPINMELPIKVQREVWTDNLKLESIDSPPKNGNSERSEFQV